MTPTKEISNTYILWIYFPTDIPYKFFPPFFAKKLLE